MNLADFSHGWWFSTSWGVRAALMRHAVLLHSLFLRKSITVSGVRPVCFVRDALGLYPFEGIPLPP
jgi:hypothetical protein